MRFLIVDKLELSKICAQREGYDKQGSESGQHNLNLTIFARPYFCVPILFSKNEVLQVEVLHLLDCSRYKPSKGLKYCSKVELIKVRLDFMLNCWIRYSRARVEARGYLYRRWQTKVLVKVFRTEAKTIKSDTLVVEKWPVKFILFELCEKKNGCRLGFVAKRVFSSSLRIFH